MVSIGLLHCSFFDEPKIGKPPGIDAPLADWNLESCRHIDALMSDLFALDARQELRDGAVLLRGRALAVDRALLDAIERVVAQSPFRQMVTPGGFQMSVAMTN